MKAYINPKVTYPKWYLAYARAMAHNFPDLSILERQAELYKRLSWVGTAIDIVSIISALADKSVKKMVGEEEEDIPNHDFEKLLLNPNPTQSGRSLIRALVADYKLHSKAYLWLNVVGNKPVELWRIPTTLIGPKTDGKMGIAYFLYDAGGGQRLQIPPGQIMYFCDYDPQKMLDPDSSLTSLSLVTSNDLTMQKWNNNVYQGNGRLPGVLHFADMIPDPMWDQIGEDIDEAASQQNILRLRGTGTGAVGWIQTSSPPKDMEFYTGRENNRDEIWSRLAPGLASMLSESATEANSRTNKATLIDLCVYPVLLLLYEAMTQQIIWRYYGEDLKIEPDDIRVTDRVLELSEKQEHSKVLTVNEYRYLWGDDDYPDPVVGKMLVTEAQTYKSVTPEPEVVQGELMEEKKPPQLPAETSNAQTDIEAQEKQIAKKASTRDPRPILLELEKWERKAIKNIGKEFEFELYNTPLDISNGVKASLIGCANPAAIKAVFDEAREGLLVEQAEEVRTDTEIIMLATALNNFASATKASFTGIDKFDTMKNTDKKESVS